ncbi:MAG: hypothetical protein IIC71_09220 [Acidobacteria bacterium]|nr:hypothetical protein [Acidobacteriota bacterium]
MNQTATRTATFARSKRLASLSVAIALTASACTGATEQDAASSEQSSRETRSDSVAVATECPTIEPARDSNDVITLTIGRTFDEILSATDVTVCVRIVDPGGATVYADGLVTRAGRSFSPETTTVSLSPDAYTLRWSYVWPSKVDRLSCAAELNLSDPFDVTATLHIRPTCLAKVEETAPWAGTQGDPAPRSEVEEFVSGGHCNWGQAHFVAIGGYFEGTAYVNDVSGIFSNSRFVSSAARLRLGLTGDFEYFGTELDATDYLTFDPDVVLPVDAVTLGYTRGFRELFTSPADDGDYLYVVSPDGVERWPRIRPVPACA